MSVMTVLVLIFFALGGIDYLFGSKLQIGKEFERGFMLLGSMALSMTGIIVISPLMADVLSPVFGLVYDMFGIDPSIIPAMLFANDMGGAQLAIEVAKDVQIGNFNALVVSSMMGATVSFTIPFALQIVQKEHIDELAIGLLCGIVTIPVGCFAAGLMCRIPIRALLFNLLPLVVLAVIIALLLLFARKLCVKLFCALGFLIRILIVTGLVLGALNFITKQEIVRHIATVEEAALICFNACFVLAGMFPLVYIISKVLTKPCAALGGKIGMDSKSVTGLIATLASNAPTLGILSQMNPRGIIVNSAFAVSAAFSLGSHMAFTMSLNAAYVAPMIVGKLIAGGTAVLLAFSISKIKLEERI